MKIFILNKNIKDINTLKNIISQNQLGLVLGISKEFAEGLEEIVSLEPDLIISDGDFSIISDIKTNTSARILVVSEEKIKEDIEKLYRMGIEYFIYKPMNEFEIKYIIDKIKYNIELEEKINQIRQIFSDIPMINKRCIENKGYEEDIRMFLLRLGIMGEVGSEDLVKVINYIIKKRIKINEISIGEICSRFSDSPKIMEQRMRRAVNMAMTNIASLGIEDYMNEIFIEYSNTLFNFEQIKKEMDYIRGKGQDGGTISLKRFLSSSCLFCQKYNN